MRVRHFIRRFPALRWLWRKGVRQDGSEERQDRTAGDPERPPFALAGIGGAVARGGLTASRLRHNGLGRDLRRVSPGRRQERAGLNGTCGQQDGGNERQNCETSTRHQASMTWKSGRG